MKKLKLFMAVAAFAMVTASASAAFKINEVDSDTTNTDLTGAAATDWRDFVELKGLPNEAGTGLIVVFFNGGSTVGATPVSYRTTDLNSAVADANGYLVIGTTNVVPTPQIIIPANQIQNGEDAIAIYQASAASFPTGTTPQSANLIDFVVYETDDDPNANWSGFGQPITIYDENGAGSPVPRTISRIPDGTGPFTLGESSPKAANIQNEGMSFAVAPLINDVFDFWRFNQATAVEGTSRTLVIRNTGTEPLTVNSVTITGGSDAAYSLITPPTFPVVLQANATVSVPVGFADPSPTTNKVYNGSLTYSTDNSTSPSGTIPLKAELVRSTNPGVVNSVVINEVSYNPQANDYNNNGISVSQDDEFTELYNTTASPILIEGWEARVWNDSLTTYNSFVFPAGATIPANGFVTIFSHGTQVGFTAGTTFAHNLEGRIYNPGSFMNINDGTTVIDALAYLAAEDVSNTDIYTNTGVSNTGGSLGRRPDGTDSFMAFPADNVILDNRPSPNRSNNGVNSARDWQMFE